MKFKHLGLILFGFFSAVLFLKDIRADQVLAVFAAFVLGVCFYVFIDTIFEIKQYGKRKTTDP